MKYDNHLLYIFLVSLLGGLIAGILLLQIKNKCFVTNDAKKVVDKMIVTLVRQAARWSTAAKQDDSPLIAVLHANYGAGYLWALKDIAPTSQIARAANIDILKFEKEIVEIQDEATTNMIRVCPDFAPPSSYLTKLSGEGI